MTKRTHFWNWLSCWRARAFVALRQYALGYADINRKLEDFMIETNMQFSDIYQALTELASQKELENKPRKRIGFNVK